jgi:hypothetical protein
MKSIIKYMFGAVVLGLMAACSPEKFDGADPNGIPSLEGVNPVVTVDQTINQVTFSVPGDMRGMTPVWMIYTNKGTDQEKVVYSTDNGLKKIFAKAGDYEVELKLRNRNGMSDGSIVKKFHIDNSIVNFDKYLNSLCGGTSDTSKEWRIDHKKQGHLGCGPTGTSGLEWWSADPEEKKDFNVYDSRVTLGSDMSYKFDPGASGQIYVNKDVTGLGGPKDEDFCVAAEKQDVTFKLDVDGDDLYLILPAHTYFPYICNDDIWNNPRYKVESITGTEMNLVADNGGIAWHYILTSLPDADVFRGYKYDSEFNLWKTVDDNNDYTTHFYYAPNWEQLPDPGFSQEGSSYTFTLPKATTDQWQAQCPIKPNALPLKASAKYDFSCILNSNVDLTGVTVKLTDVASGDNFVFVERVDLKAHEDYVFYLTEVNELKSDANCELFFDFGGNPDNTEVTVSDIVVKDHANDDGTVVPLKVEWNVDAETNLWKAVEDGSKFISVTPWFANESWSQVEDPEWTHEEGVWTILINNESNNQWQSQFPINTSLTASASKKYNFYCVVEADHDVSGITIKLTESDESETIKHDDNFFFQDRHDVTAKSPYKYVAKDVSLAKADAHALTLIFDFGGCPKGTNIKISHICFEEAN